MIDKQQFNNFFQGFDKDFLPEFIDIAIIEIPATIEAISKNIENVDFDGLSRNACKIKGIIPNFYDPVSTGLSRQLWDYVYVGWPKPELENRTMDDKIHQMFSELKTATELLVDELKLIKQELTSG